MDLDKLNNKFTWLIAAGICGGLVGLGMDKEHKEPTQRFMFLFGGLACSFFLAGPIATHFGLVEPGEIASVGFAVAIFWQMIISKIGATIAAFRLPFAGGANASD